LKRRSGSTRRGAQQERSTPSPVPAEHASGAPNLRVVRFEPIPYANLTDQVYQAIKHRILSNELEVGSRLRDEELATQLGVSRTPVREAILRLSGEGLVEIIPRSGTRVRHFTEEDIEEIFDLRIALEALAIRKAAVRLEPAQVQQLRASQEAAEAALGKGETTPALDFDSQLHRTILQAAGNQRLQEMMATINDCVTLFRNIGAGTPFHRGYTYRHRDLIRALERRDPELAARFMAEHIETAKKELFRDFRHRKLLTSGDEQARLRSASRSRRQSAGGGETS
jgi:DNA-binding GntR family transcriptional regulator